MLKTAHFFLLFSLLFSTGLSVKAEIKNTHTFSIDFKTCKPSFKSVGFDFDSSHFQIVGQSKHGCIMLYGTEIENPRWNEFLSRICVIPKKLGEQNFIITQMGLKLSKIKPYCTATPRAVLKK